MTPVTVTLVIAAYRAQADHLGAAISSALGQTEPCIEVIVADDSPDDRLRQLVESFRDPRLSYRSNSPALGVARNHWESFARARGEFVAILNHDDTIEPTFIETLLPPLLSGDTVALSFCDHWLIDASGRRLEPDTDAASRLWGRTTLREGLHRPFLDLLAAQSIPMAMGTIFRKALLPRELPRHAGPAYDLWLTYLLARTGKAAYYVPHRLSSWRTHPGNLTSQAGTDWLQGAAECWAAVSADPLCGAIRSLARAKAAVGLSSVAIRALANGRRAEAASLASRSMRMGFTRKAGAAWLLARLPGSIARPLVAAARAR